MIRIKGPRGSGKTTKLLYLADETGAVIVEPTSMMKDFVLHAAKRLGLDHVAVISMHELLTPHCSAEYRERGILIDELSMFLRQLNVHGYTDTDD